MATSTNDAHHVISSEDKELWYRALFEEDCRAVMGLLNAHRHRLLMVGWKCEPEREVEGRRRREGTGSTQSEWKGRTALHVGASRGCIELILQVLGLCNIDGFSRVNAAYRRTLLGQTSANTHSRLDENDRALAHGSLARTITLRSRYRDHEVSPDSISKMDCQRLLLAKDGESGLDALAIALLHHKQELYLLLCYGLEHCDLKDHPHYRGTFEMAWFDKTITDLFDSDRVKEDMEKRKQLRQVTVAATMAFIESVEQFFGDGEDGPSEDDSDQSQVALEQFSGDGEDDPGEDDSDQYQDAVEQFSRDDSNQSRSIPIRPGDPIFEPPPSTRNRSAFCEYIKVHGAQTLHTRAFEEYRARHPSTTPSFELDNEIVSQHSVFKDYFNHRDFNFLPPEEYLFHFLCSDGNSLGVKLMDPRTGSTSVDLSMLTTLWTAISSWQGTDALWRFLLQFKDGQGRGPLHVAVDGLSPTHFIDLVLDEDYTREDVARDVIVLLATTVDDGDRTPVHRAAATGRDEAIKKLLELAYLYPEVAATCHECRDVYTKSDRDASRNAGFSLKVPLAHNALHAALIHKNFQCAELLLEKGHGLDHMTYRSNTESVYQQNEDEGEDVSDTDGWFAWDIVEFAFLARAPLTFIRRLKESELAKTKPYKQRKQVVLQTAEEEIWEHPWHPLHLAASLGRYDLIEFLLDLGHEGNKLDPLIEDFEGNSALHHAMKIREFELHTHLFDYVNSEHCSLSKNLRAAQMDKEKVLDDNRIAERQGCINRLLQEGCDVFKISKKKRIPYPRGSLKDKNFLSWWYRKQEKEFIATQSNLNFATNAIVVTAALVATASYVGPLQPPMGYDASQIQYRNIWVSIFIVCDSLSFYLAIVAITLALIPSLSIPQQAMREELQRTRGMVILAVGILLPSIICVFVAFASSSISVMSASITSETGGILTIVCSLLGAVFCSLAFSLFFIRLVTYIFPKNPTIRYLYKISNYVTNFSIVS